MIGVVIVTYNRLDKLKKTLQLFEYQTVKPDYMIILNNCSNDGTKEYLEEWKRESSYYEKIVISTELNLGGSGGFSRALSEAIKQSSDWIWISDDDAFPEENAIEVSEKCIREGNDDLVAICGQVINCGSIDVSHRKKIYTKGLNIVSEAVPVDEYIHHFEINAFSYVGTIVRKDILEKVGVTKKEYFIWYDDTEHSMRFSKEGKIVCCPEIKIHHDVGPASTEYSWKSYYGLRNSLDMYRLHFSQNAYCYTVFKRIVMSFIYTLIPNKLLGVEKEYVTLYKRALKDAMKEKLGIDDIYKPGWKSSIK